MMTKKKADEFINKPGVSAWDDIDSEDDSKWLKAMKKLLVTRSNKPKADDKRSAS